MRKFKRYGWILALAALSAASIPVGAQAEVHPSTDSVLKLDASVHPFREREAPLQYTTGISDPQLTRSDQPVWSASAFQYNELMPFMNTNGILGPKKTHFASAAWLHSPIRPEAGTVAVVPTNGLSFSAIPQSATALAPVPTTLTVVALALAAFAVHACVRKLLPLCSES